MLAGVESLVNRDIISSRTSNVRSRPPFHPLTSLNSCACLSEYIKPTLLIPQHRLATLLEQAKSYQRLNCVFHTADAAVSLLADCNCDPATFPAITTNILQGHTDEIWRLEFSHGGDRLATAGRDKTAIIWNVKVSSLACDVTGH